MNDLLFYTLLIALLYYFFLYLPKQKQIEPIKPLTHSQTTQTEPNPTEDNSQLEPILDHLIKSIQQLNKSLK